MSFKPIDARRDEYRKYLERTGVLDTLNNVILKLYETPDPRPENAIEFIRRSFGDSMVNNDTIEQLKRELEDSRNEVAKLEKQLETVKLEISRVNVPVLDSTTTAPVETSNASSNEHNNEKDDSSDIVSNEEISAVIASETELKVNQDVDEANYSNIVDANEKDAIEKESKIDVEEAENKNDASDVQIDAEVKDENDKLDETTESTTSVEDDIKPKSAEA